VTSWAYSRPRRRRLGPPRFTRAGLELRLARHSLCPHCGRMSPTVQGVCADCWGSKGGQQFWVRKTGPSPDDPLFDRLSPYLIGAVAAAVPAIVLALLLWIWG
jgi:hypothetical protein